MCSSIQNIALDMKVLLSAPANAAQFNSNSKVFASELLENLEEMRFGTTYISY